MKNEITNEIIEQTDVSLLTPFSKHPYHVRDDEDLQALTESVREYGILTPIIARKVGDRIEVISGHRRRAAAIQAGLKTVPVIYRNVDDDEATIMMVDSNFQRENLLPSEKAFAYKMKLDAMKHQGKATSAQLEPKLRRSNELLASQSEDSRATIQRYIRLTYLIKPILDKVDGGEIALSPAVELSYLSKTAQDWLCDAMELNQCTPSYSQSVRLHVKVREGTLTMDDIYAIMREEKANQKEKISFVREKFAKYFPSNYSSEQIESGILKILEERKRKIQARSDRDDR